jgi:hypothetical protein
VLNLLPRRKGMNARQWRDCGYRTVFRKGNIYLYFSVTGLIIWTLVNKGDWMSYDDVYKEPWNMCNLVDLPEKLQKEIAEAAKKCYCDKGVGICDFCAGIR